MRVDGWQQGTNNTVPRWPYDNVEFSAALLKLSDLIVEVNDQDELGYASSEILGQALEVSRVGYSAIVTETETLRTSKDWCAPGVFSLAGILQLRDYGSFIDSLKRGEFISIASDITARKQAELALVGAEKLAVVGRLASSIAHEINNPLEAVTNLLFIAEQTADAETKSTLVAAQQELQRVSQIAANTLQFNRQKLLPAPMNVSKSVQSVLSLYEGRIRQAGIEVVFEKARMSAADGPR